MKVALSILAAGTFVTWLFFGRLNGLLAATMPFHGLERESLSVMVAAVLSSSGTWLALLVVVLGFGTSWMRMRGSKQFAGGWLQPFVDTSFGFEPLNRVIVRSVSNFAERLRSTQTGELNWNILGILGGLLAVLVVLWMGA
jgi:hypothetical protein